MNRKIITGFVGAVGLAVASAALVSGPAMAIIPDSLSAVNTNEAGIALRGFDPVAYFDEGEPVRGTHLYTAEYDGATYRFSSEANRDIFMAEPAAFAPQFGGFCAMGVALGRKLDGDPEIWRIVDGKLYLNVNQQVSVAWQRDIPGNIARAEENWPEIMNRAPSSLE